MSFPHMKTRLAELGLDLDTVDEQTMKEIALEAAEKNTPMGWAALKALVTAFREGTTTVVEFIQNALREAGFNEEASNVLRFERLPSGALKVDFTPFEGVGLEIARLLTDGMRKVLADCHKVTFGLANCCGVIVGEQPQDVHFTLADQARWQNSIDC